MRNLTENQCFRIGTQRPKRGDSVVITTLAIKVVLSALYINDHILFWNILKGGVACIAYKLNKKTNVRHYHCCYAMFFLILNNHKSLLIAIDSLCSLPVYCPFVRIYYFSIIYCQFCYRWLQHLFLLLIVLLRRLISCWRGRVPSGHEAYLST